MSKIKIALAAALFAIWNFPANADTTQNYQTKNDNSQSITFSVENFTDTVPQSVIASWANHQSSLNISDDKSEIENQKYCPDDFKMICSISITNKQRSFFRLNSDIQINKDLVRAYLEDLARKVNRDPEDAKFTIVDGRVQAFSEARNGMNLNIEKSLDMTLGALKNPSLGIQKIDLPFETKKPALNYADVNNLGINSLIGEGVSNFKGSPTNRIKNIKVAIQRFNGVLIKPGEEFSFVSILGEVDADHGYFPELVIKKGVTEPEFGGGICQVSTTVFRAAIYSGLKITARRNHAYPVSYYSPQGMDSTVYVPQPDLRFKNNTPGYILIQAKINGTELVFDFYGTDDGRKTVVDGPRITERQPDGAMKTTFTQHVYDKDGSEFINDVFNSAYASPYKYPHLGGPVLNAKPSNWSSDEWKSYKKTIKDLAKADNN